MYRTYEDWEKDFPFWCNSTIRSNIEKLEKAGLLLSGSYNKMPTDRIKWYAVDYDALNSRIQEYES